MKLVDAKTLAELYLEKHGLSQKGWKFQFEKTKNRLGVCHSRIKRIGLSRDFILMNDEKLIEDTILHEIAHALVGPFNKHNRTWKLMAIKLGATPRARARANMPKGKYAVRCVNCGIIGYQHRRSKYIGVRNRFYCKKCKGEVVIGYV